MRDFGLSDPDICCTHTHIHTHTYSPQALICFFVFEIAACVWGVGVGGAAHRRQKPSCNYTQAHVCKHIYINVCMCAFTVWLIFLRFTNTLAAAAGCGGGGCAHTQLTAESVYMRVCDYFREYESMYVCVCVCARVHARGINLSLWWGCCSERGVLLIQLSLIMSTRPLSTLTTQYTHNELRRLCVCAFVCKRESHTNTFN